MPIPVRSLPPPAKKRKIEPSKTAQNVQKLEDQISEAVSKNASLNALADLVELACTATQAEDVSKAIYALYRTFVTIIHRGNFVLAGDENAKVVKTWLWDQLNTYVEFLAGLLQDDEKSLRTSALQVLMSLQKHLSTSFSEHSSPPNPQFHASHFRRIVNALLLCPSSSRKAQEGSSSDRKLDPEVLNMFHDTWFSVHDDIRWFFLREAGSIMSKITTEQQHYVSGNLLSILERLNTFPTESAELNAWWVEELGIKPPKTKRQKIDGSNESDEEDEPTNENEEEEDDWRKFFDDDTTMKTAPKAKAPAGRVHTLTVHQSLHSLQSHRAVFTRAWLSLLPKLSIQGDASATKALALRALNVMHRGVLPHLTRPVLVMDWIGACVDYGGAVGLLALNALYALMKEYNLDYPSFYTRLYAFLDRDVLHLKHRARFFHPFNASEINPLLTDAISSSLWEIQTHRSHYHSAVSTLAKIFSEAFTKPKYSMEDFLDHTYVTLFDAEANRKIKKEPALAVELDQQINLFGKTDAVGVVGDLWTFEGL
uniref:CCAAT-binding factor domain-containing protein n=1 Tax=Moniliophthora roreri TaxID=221103 RepID=A0A0W0EW87_MONRR